MKNVFFVVGLLLASTTIFAQTESISQPEVEAAYPNGMEAFRQYFVDNVNYPEAAEKDKVEGTVYVQFKVDKDGSIQSPKVLRGVRSDIDQEAVRVIQGMPNWVPATTNNEPVPSMVTLPVKFTI